jgi:hypothetical protein
MQEHHAVVLKENQSPVICFVGFRAEIPCSIRDLLFLLQQAELTGYRFVLCRKAELGVLRLRQC